MQVTKPKRPELRTESDRAELSTRLCVRLPIATARQLEQLAKRSGAARVTVLCDLISLAAQAKR